MFTVRITEVEAHENGQYSNVIREYTHRSPKVAYARATEWGWWKWCSVKKTGYITPYGGTPIARQMVFKNNGRITSSEWEF